MAKLIAQNFKFSARDRWNTNFLFAKNLKKLKNKLLQNLIISLWIITFDIWVNNSLWTMKIGLQQALLNLQIALQMNYYLSRLIL